MAMCAAANSILYAFASFGSASPCAMAVKWFHVDCEDAALRSKILGSLFQLNNERKLTCMLFQFTCCIHIIDNTMPTPVIELLKI